DTNRHERAPTWSQTRICAERPKMQDGSAAFSIEVEQNIGHENPLDRGYESAWYPAGRCEAPLYRASLRLRARLALGRRPCRRVRRSPRAVRLRLRGHID